MTHGILIRLWSHVAYPTITLVIYRAKFKTMLTFEASHGMTASYICGKNTLFHHKQSAQNDDDL